jgi:hypothetical protein
MNGARADPSVRTMKRPNSTRAAIIGPSHHFFRTFIYIQNSETMPNFRFILFKVFNGRLLS